MIFLLTQAPKAYNIQTNDLIVKTDCTNRRKNRCIYITLEQQKCTVPRLYIIISQYSV